MADRTDKEREAEELLPWYVNGTLSEEEEEAVRRYLQGNENAGADVEMLRRVRDAVKSEAFGSPGEFGLRRLRKAIDEEPRRPAAGAGAGSWWRPAMAAAVLVIAVQAVLLIDGWRSGGTYEPAGADSERPVIQLRFDPAATEGEIRGLLNELELEIVKGPGSAGVYRVVPGRGDADAGQLLDRLRDVGDVVVFAEIE